MLIGRIFKEKSDSKPDNVQLLGAERSYCCPLIIEFPSTTLLSHSFALLSLFSLWENKVDKHTIGNNEARKERHELSL
jgi:hypothetical protein